MSEAIANVGYQSKLDAMIVPNPRPTRADLAAFDELVAECVLSDDGHSSRTRDEIIRILGAAARRMEHLSEAVRRGREERDERRRRYRF